MTLDVPRARGNFYSPLPLCLFVIRISDFLRHWVFRHSSFGVDLVGRVNYCPGCDYVPPVRRKLARWPSKGSAPQQMIVEVVHGLSPIAAAIDYDPIAVIET